MSQKPFEAYIQKQIEAALAEEARLNAEAQAEETFEQNKRKAQSLANTLRAFALMGIEVGESDLVYDETAGFRLLFKTVLISLQFSKGVNWIDDEKRYGYAHCIRFTVRVFRSLPPELLNEDGDWPRGFYHSLLSKELEVDVKQDDPITDLSEYDMHYIFAAIHEVEKNFQSAFASYQATAAQKQIVTRKIPRYAYEGDSREQILAAVLNDIQRSYAKVEEL